MEKNLFLIILLIFFFNICYSYEKNNNYGNKTEEINFFESNPYQILGIPPWTKFEHIEKRYNKLKEKFESKNKLKSEEFKAYKEAYKRIKKEYEENGGKEKTFFGVIKNSFKKLFLYELILFAVLFLSWTIYKFSSFAAFLVIVCVSVNNLIPHFFSDMTIQYIFSFCLAIFLYFGNSLLCKNKEDKSEDDGHREKRNGTRIRRRFEKFE